MFIASQKSGPKTDRQAERDSEEKGTEGLRLGFCQTNEDVTDSSTSPRGKLRTSRTDGKTFAFQRFIPEVKGKSKITCE